MVLVLSVMLSTSCSDDFLDIVPKTEYSDAIVWSDPGTVQLFLNNMYRAMDDPHCQRAICIMTDECYRDHETHIAFNAGLITPDLIPGWDRKRGKLLLIWGEYYHDNPDEGLYAQVRRANIFFENIHRTDFGAKPEEKDRMRGEVYFIRAWSYFHLAKMYGGVPIITRTYGLNDDYAVARDSFEDVIEFVVQDLDSAAALLPLKNDLLSTPTKGAALALKSRVLITAASDLFNTVVFPDYPYPELIGYTDKSAAARTARWQRAKDAAKVVIDLGQYDLYQGKQDSVTLNFVDYFTSTSPTEEDILLRYMNETGQYYNNMGYWTVGEGFGGQFNVMPLGQMVDAYERRDGSEFDWNNPEHAASPYEFRDPRLYSSILYDGAHWRERPEGLRAFDPEGIVQTGYYEIWDSIDQEIRIEQGLDAEKIGALNTGYMNRKWLSPEYDHMVEYQPVTFRMMRYAEVLFNYAEACIELGEDEEARIYLNMIRNRADMPEITESGDALRDKLRHEKRIEMFYEDMRFWDIRRWLIGPESQTPAEKIVIWYRLLPDKTTSTVPEYNPELVPESPKRKWINKMYFFPIYRKEINRNPALVQNPDYI